MVKDLKVWKKNIATATTAMVIATIAMTGCSKEKIEPEETYDTVYYTTYDEYGQNYVWQEISKEDYQNMDDSIIAETQQEDTTLYAASYQSLGYMAAQKNETKQEAVTNNPKYKDNSQFLAGFDLGKQDKYERKAKEEQKQYVAIKKTAEPTSSMDETEYYPVEDLTVVSYNGANALVTDYNEDAVKAGNYEDLLGKDMSSYVGKDFVADSLQRYTVDYFNVIPDSMIGIVAGDFNKIPEIAADTFPTENKLTDQNTK